MIDPKDKDAEQSGELREQDVGAGDRLDDRVEETEGLPRHEVADDLLPPADAPEHPPASERGE